MGCFYLVITNALCNFLHANLVWPCSGLNIQEHNYDSTCHYLLDLLVLVYAEIESIVKMILNNVHLRFPRYNRIVTTNILHKGCRMNLVWQGLNKNHTLAQLFWIYRWQTFCCKNWLTVTLAYIFLVTNESRANW